ncbi:MAG: alanine--tRNA ligase [Gammaproteobacteria bacterium]|nr:alanine--tRNA ligase [Gammaproteobacteria bacterium]
MKTSEIRSKFLAYFKQHGHSVVSSSSLIPGNDPTLLFTNAGMVQFKDVFLGMEQRPYNRATSSQCCVRAGGKHNDLDNVGYTARHHTFFEMLGNFSFGDYFKKAAIEFAWKFLTQELKIPKEKLWITVYKDDKEAEDIWLNDIGVSRDQFAHLGEKSNFWSMGDTGPCGPCTEIFYDHGDSIPGGPPGSPEEDGDRYVEIWNLVFMQFNRHPDGSMTPLPKPSVDTGMGLERIAAVKQQVHSNYDIDLFQHLIQATQALLLQAKLSNDEESLTSIRVIADHIRSVAFLIADGVIPSNEGRGYVLRRILRRAIRHGKKLGLSPSFFHEMVQPLVDVMGDAYPRLIEEKDRIISVLKREEDQFEKTLDQGMQLLEEAFAKISGQEIPGEVVFKLYDTYGFPTDLTADIARERGFAVDYAGFDEAMGAQRKQSQSASQFAVDYTGQLQVQGETAFTGYDKTTDEATVTALFDQDGKATKELIEGQSGIVILDRTPFYAEAGGQIGDKGKIQYEQGYFRVSDTKKQGMVHLHYGKINHGVLRVNTKVDAEVDSDRQSIMINHTATHLLHAALRRVVGAHVIQKGSLVAADRLRFDYAHHEPMTPQQILDVERLVNQQIRANLTGNVETMSPEQATKKGAMALFGEKYGDEVRVLSIGEFSMELCGGTHVKHTGEIGLFKIISETGIAAGIRRLEAVTGDAALTWLEETESHLLQAAQLLKTNRQNIILKLEQSIEEKRQLEKEINQLKSQLAGSKTSDLISQAKDINGVKVLAARVDGVDVKTARDLIDQLKDKLGSAIILIATVEDQKVRLVAGATKNCADRLSAGELVNFVAAQLGGKGGGRSELAQGSGENPEKLDEALDGVFDWVKAQEGGLKVAQG